MFSFFEKKHSEIIIEFKLRNRA